MTIDDDDDDDDNDDECNTFYNFFYIFNNKNIKKYTYLNTINISKSTNNITTTNWYDIWIAMIFCL